MNPFPIPKTKIYFDDKNRLKRSRYKVIYGGRGSGKSWFFAILILLLCYQRKLRILCVREVQNSLDESVYQLILAQIEKLGLQNEFYEAKNKICSRSGSEIIFLGMYRNINKIKSLEGIDICWIEEASDISLQSWNVLVPTIRKKDSEIWLSFNPSEEEDIVYQNFIINDRPDSITLRLNYMDNPQFPEVLKKEMEYDKENDVEKYNHVWLGELDNRRNARVFHNYVIHDFDIKEDKIKQTGFDFGYNDPNAGIVSYVHDQELYIIAEYHETLQSPDEFVRSIKQIDIFSKAVLFCENEPSVIKMMKAAGLRPVSAIKGKGSVMNGIKYLQHFKKIHIHKTNCPHTAHEFAKYEFKIDKKTERILDDFVDMYNHHIDALRYAHSIEIKKYIQKRRRVA